MCIPGSSLPWLVNAARTDSCGEYTITGLETGVYAVEVKRLGYVTQKKDCLAVAVNQDIGDIDFSIGKTARVGSISGVVRKTADGMPLEGTEISLLDGEGNAVYIGNGNLTDRSGTYAISGLVPDNYYVYGLFAHSCG